MNLVSHVKVDNFSQHSVFIYYDSNYVPKVYLLKHIRFLERWLLYFVLIFLFFIAKFDQISVQIYSVRKSVLFLKFFSVLF